MPSRLRRTPSRVIRKALPVISNKMLMISVDSASNCILKFRSKPHPDTRDPLHVTAVTTGAARKCRRLAKLLRPVDADIRREFAQQFIAQAQAEFRVRQTSADAGLGVVFSVDINFQLWRQNQLLRNQYIVFRVQTQRAAALGADEQCDIGFKKIRRQSLHTQRQPVARWLWLHVVAHADLHIEEWRNGAAVQSLDFSVFGGAIAALTFGF